MQPRTARLALAAAAVLCLLPALASAAPRRPLPGCHDARAIARFLGLTAEQNAQVKTLRTTLKTTVDPIQDGIADLRDQIQDLFEATTPDACAIGALTVQIHGDYERIEAARDTFEAGFEALLTPEQLTKWNALKVVCSAAGETTGS